MILAQQPPVVRDRPVFVVTTRGGRHLFGVHRADRRDLYTSYVLGFDRAEHAQALAKGLEAYRRAHGEFPPRDLSVADMDLARHDHEAIEDLAHVGVDEVPLAELLWRLRGTAIVLSLLTAVETGQDEFSFTWRDVRPDGEWRQAAVARLDALLRDSRRTWSPGRRMADAAQAAAAAADVPALLPKPRRPQLVGRVLGALCRLARRLPHNTDV